LMQFALVVDSRVEGEQLLVWRAFFFFSSRRRHTRWPRDWSSDVCSSDLEHNGQRLVVIPNPWLSALGAHRVLSIQRCLWLPRSRSEERRVGKECRTRRAPYY